MELNVLSQQFDSFSHSLRFHLEQNFDFFETFDYDQDEAVGNLEQSFNGILNAFHSLYDSARHYESKVGKIDFYNISEIAPILAIRNSRHHQAVRPIDGMYQDMRKRYGKYISDYPIALVKFEENGGRFIEYYLSAQNFIDYLALPNKDNHLSQSSIKNIYEYIPLARIIDDVQQSVEDKNNVFVNAIPMIINAGIRLYPFIRQHVKPLSVESEHFCFHFESVPVTPLSAPKIDIIQSQ
jgi:hypothetical protein